MKPCRASRAHTCEPYSGRSLANCDLDLCHVNLIVKPVSDLCFRSSLKEQLKSFPKVRPGLVNRTALARNINLWTKRNKAITFPLDDRRKLSCHSHLSHTGADRTRLCLAGL